MEPHPGPRFWTLLAAGTVISMLAGSPAHAFRPADDRDRNATHAGAEVELASGDEPRAHIEVVRGPRPGNAAWRRFVSSAGGTWSVMWDRDTGVPSRIWGSGLSAPGAVSSKDIAASFARRFLAEHVALLAPGASADDFRLVSNTLSRGVRSVGFEQTLGGSVVAGGQIGLRFKADRLIAISSEAWPRLAVDATGSAIDRREAARAAIGWIEKDYGAGAEAGEVKGPLIRAFVLADGTIASERVLSVIVSTRKPVGRWEVDVSARTGQVFARRQMLRFFTGSLRYNVPVRRPGGARVDTPAKNADITVDGAATRAGDDGSVTWTSTAPAQITATAVSPLVRVIDAGGAAATASFELTDTGTAVWNESRVEKRDSQLTAFVATRTARDYVDGIAPDFTFIDRQMQVTVNMNEVCNAFSDGMTTNFFIAGGGCENTGRLPDVVQHEYGHTIHANAVIQGLGSFDSSLSEGASDYLAATITGDSGMGRGFFFGDEPLRELDPRGEEAIWPRDRGEPHVTGLIYAGALWDVRKGLIDALGQEAGVALTDQFWWATLERASNIMAAYVEVVVADDDDGNLANGTPNFCLITDAFVAHGLADPRDAGPSIGVAELDGFRAGVPVGTASLCPGGVLEGAALVWDVRGQEGSGGRIPLERDGERLIAAIPPQAEGSVLRYKIELTRADGKVLSLPDNAADPMYEAFIGVVRPLYCTDFEVDPLAEGWSHALLRASSTRASDEWEWGKPAEANGSGDPESAYSGQSVVGNDLGMGEFSMGTYGRNKTEELLSPAIDVAGATNVRLQYRRWLTVEDGDGDQAEIVANGELVWKNFASGTGNGTTNHIDKEWRFHDVDLTEVAAASDGQLQIGFRLTSDRSVQFGGWTIDDFCVVAWDGPTARCGDSKVDTGEQCDDGNTTAGDGCEADCTATPVACGNGRVEAAERCDDGNTTPGDGCEADCTPTPPPELCPDGTAKVSGQCPATQPSGLDESDEKSCGCTATSVRDRRGAAIDGLLLALAALALILGRRARR